MTPIKRTGTVPFDACARPLPEHAVTMLPMTAPTASPPDDERIDRRPPTAAATTTQDDVVVFLGAPGCPAFVLDVADTGDDGAAATLVETHAARVFVGERVVCKLKRAVAYGYLDTTSLETRRQLCERELALNRPSLPDIYVDVVPITREADGRLAIDGRGAAVDWLLRMRRFPHHAVLDEIARAGRLDAALARRLGGSIARYHETRPVDASGDGHRRVREVVDELAAELAALDAALPADDARRFVAAARGSLERHRALLERRASSGFVRRCHGDLHLANLVLHDGEPVPFDALEFDERLATTDVLYDLAFLVMDLGHRGLAGAQNLVLNEYLLHSPPENLDGLAVLPLFIAMRAAVRAMTTAQAARLDPVHAPERGGEARDYLAAAIDALAPRSPILVALGGLSGSGKSTAAAALGARVAHAPGAILLGSDAERKAALGVAAGERLDPTRYTPTAAVYNYRLLRAKARRALGAGFSVVLDATLLDAAERDTLGALAREHGLAFVGLWLDAPPATLRRRVAARHGDVSDATPAVLERQLERAPAPPPRWVRIDAGDAPADTLRRCLAAIERVRADGR